MPPTKAFPPSSGPFRPTAILFVGLNALRLLSIVTLCLVFSSQIVGIKNDVQAVNAAKAEESSFNSTSSLEEYAIECEYIEYSAVPDQTGGVFWAELNRVFLLIFCLILLASELSLPSKPLARFYERYIPVLSNRHGLGILGAMQCWIAANVLSKWVEKFEQVSGWLLFILGCINLLVGIWLKHEAKEKRLIFSWENVTSLTPQTSAAYGAYKVYDEKLKPFTLNTYKNARESQGKSAAPSHKATNSTEDLLPRTRPTTEGYVEPRLTGSTDRTAVNKPNVTGEPSTPRSPGWRFGGFGFGKQSQKSASERGITISKPVGTLPSGRGRAFTQSDADDRHAEYAGGSSYI